MNLLIAKMFLPALSRDVNSSTTSATRKIINK